MTRYYEQGFIDKCAELGVDPRALVKKANLKARLTKLAQAPQQATPQQATPPRIYHPGPQEILENVDPSILTLPREQYNSATNRAAQLMDLNERTRRNVGAWWAARATGKPYGAEPEYESYNVSQFSRPEYLQLNPRYSGNTNSIAGSVFSSNSPFQFSPEILTNSTDKAFTDRIHQFRRASDEYHNHLRDVQGRINTLTGAGLEAQTQSSAPQYRSILKRHGQ